jgi:hypothetical protein
VVTLWRWLFGCRHADGLLRESRDQVKGFACAICGHWQPQIDRTKAERRKLLKQIQTRVVVTKGTRESKIRRIG